MKRLIVNNRGQGTVEYTLLIGLVVVIIWAVIANTGIVQTVKGIWGDVDGKIPGRTPFSNHASRSGGATGGSGGVGAGGSSGGGSTRGSRDDGNANAQYSSATNQPAQEEGGGEQNSGENGGRVQEPASDRVLSGVSSISESRWNNLSMSLGLALFVLIASVIPLIVWIRIKSVEKGEISFQGLQADQIVAKIRDTA